jgi:gliding motility-associated-like protein
VITRTYSITDDCGNNTTVSQLITVSVSTPSPLISFSNPTICGGQDGTISFSNLIPNHSYDISFNGSTVTYTANGAGEVVITGLSQGTYGGFVLVSAICADCPLVISTQVVLTDPTSPTIDAGQDVAICFGDSITLTAQNPQNAQLSWSGGIQDGVPFTPQVGINTYTVTANLNNCLSTDSVVITVNPIYTGTETGVICEGEVYTFGGTDYMTSGSYPFTFQTINGCDSTVTLNLTVHPTYSIVLPVEICDGEVFTYFGQDYSTTGSYPIMFNTIQGCDSLMTIDLIVHPVYSGGEQNVSICEGETYSFGGTEYSVSGSYAFTFQTIQGCDSTVTLNLTVNPVYTGGVQTESICEGESFVFGGIVYNQTGNYPHTFATIFGCDSIVTLNLTVHPFYGSTNVVHICEGDSYTFFGQTFNQTGVYPVPFTTVHGCDSIINIDLTVHDPQASFTVAPPMGCVPLSVTFQNTSSPGVVDWVWNFGNGNTGTGSQPTHVYTNQGTYTVTLSVTDNYGCQDEVTVNDIIYVSPVPVAGFTGLTPTMWEDQSLVNITDASVGASQWFYSISDGSNYTSSNVLHLFTQPGIYTVTQIVSNAAGCADTASMAVELKPVTELYIPNSFTPNTDFTNEVFRAYGENIREFEMMIFNRWGELIFRSADINFGWDGYYKGEECKQDVYIYKVIYINHMNTEVERIGSFILIR